MEINLTNKIILLTGASDGIGKAIAESLLTSGATVALHYRSQKESVEKLVKSYPSTNSAIFQADLTIESAAQRLWEEVIRQYGKVDAVIHNAGIFEPHDTDLPIDEWMVVWHRIMQVNLSSVALISQLAINHFKEQGDGRFVFIASRAAFRGETEEYMAYAASKGGLVSLARTIARSFGKYNIKAFVIAPGFTRTAMAEQFIESYGEERILNEIALPSLTKPTDIAPVITLICSGLMDHATGSTIDINAGSYMR